MRRAAVALGMLLGMLACHQRLPPLDDHQARVRFRPIERDQLADVLRSAPRRDEDRLNQLAAQFRGVGCEELAFRPVLRAPHPNLVCILPGESSQRIVVGANYDRPSGSRGFVENWSGSVMLPALYWAISSERRHHTFEFVGFSNATRRRVLAATETWNLGSRHFLRSQTREEVAKIRAMVNLIALGLGETSAWGDQGDPELFVDLGSVAAAMSLPLRVRNFRPFFYADALQFQMNGVPSITIHSYDQVSYYLVSDPTRDNSPDRIDPDAYLASYRLVAAYLAYLDQSLVARATKQLRASGAAAQGEAQQADPQ